MGPINLIISSRRRAEGWPKELTGPLVWTTTDAQDEDMHIYVLTEDEKMELNNALKYFKGMLSEL